MTHEQAKSELMQIYMSLSEEKKKAIDVLLSESEKLNKSAEPTLDSIRESIEEYVCNVETDTTRAQKMLNAWRAIEYDEPLPSADKWIPVSERLPETIEDVLVAVNGLVARDNEISIGYYGNINPITKNLEWFVYEEYSTDVIAWMPLPEPYEPQERSDKNDKRGKGQKFINRTH